jgi:hypothetical protein
MPSLDFYFWNAKHSLTLQVIQNLHKGMKSSLSVCICIQDTFELYASIHPLLVFKAPMTADVPLLRKVLRPVLQKGLSGLQINETVSNLLCFSCADT